MRYFLELCLQSVQLATKSINAEIIVVDNDSSDDSCRMVKEKFPEIGLIENQKNFGFSKGNNIGVAKARGEYVCILNPDTVVAEDTFTTLLKFADSKKNTGIVGCKLIDGTGKFLPESKRNIPTPVVAIKKILGSSKTYYANHINMDEIGIVDVQVGAFMLIKRSVYEELSGFDEDYFMYGEDIDLSYRVKMAGYKNYYNPQTTVLHFKGESTLKDQVYAERFYGAMHIFYKKHFKQNLIFDFLVWLGIKFAKQIKIDNKSNLNKPKQYVLISNSENQEISKRIKPFKLASKIDQALSNQEVVFDANFMSFKDIIHQMGLFSNAENITFKILPKNANFILGSNHSKLKVEVVVFKN